MAPRRQRGRHVHASRRPPWWQWDSWQELGWAFAVVALLYVVGWLTGVVMWP